MMMKKVLSGAALALVFSGSDGMAQDQPKGIAPPGPKAIAPLKVQLLLTKFDGEKKVVSLPYTLPCNADDRASQLRMGIEVPVMTAAKDGPPAYQYKNVGTNIDCKASTLDDGRYRLEMGVEHSSVYSTPEDAARPPLFRTFRTSFVPVLRDGQTQQYTVATDPVSGEVVKVEVTLVALK